MMKAAAAADDQPVNEETVSSDKTSDAAPSKQETDANDTAGEPTTARTEDQRADHDITPFVQVINMAKVVTDLHDLVFIST